VVGCEIPERFLTRIENVSFFLDLSSGVGYCPNRPDPNQAYSVVKTSCATGYYSFAHEIGHNMGCQHNRKDSGAAGINWGYLASDHRSIMSYGNTRRVLNFSSANDEVTWDGKKKGPGRH
jgi:hypothetical protein